MLAWSAALLALSAGFGLRAQPVLAKPAPCLPDFSFQQGWLGGDGIYSVSLASGKTIWLFGDTFVNPTDSQAKTRAGAGMVANTLAISHCDQRGFQLDYHWRQGPDGSALAFFQPPAQSGADSGNEAAQHSLKYWPIHGFEQGGKLYLALEEVRTTPGPENGFNFAVTGVTLAEVENPTDSPRHWRIRYRPLSQGPVIPGIAIVKKDEWLYLLSVREDAEKQHPLLLQRLPLSALAQQGPLPQQLSYLSAQRNWQPGPAGPDAAVLVPKGASEASLHYVPARREWLLLHTSPDFFSPAIVVHKAPALEGPWQTAATLPFYTEMLPAWPGFDRNSFCYAAKAHPAFSTPHGLLVTYACNSLSFETLLQRPELYRPVVSILPLP